MKSAVIFGGRVQPLFILEGSDQIPVLAAVSTEEKTTIPGCKLCYRCHIDLHVKVMSYQQNPSADAVEVLLLLQYI